jgi:hypothetical protein
MGLPDDEVQKLTCHQLRQHRFQYILIRPPPSPPPPTACRLQPCRVSSKTKKPRSARRPGRLSFFLPRASAWLIEPRFLLAFAQKSGRAAQPPCRG